MLQFNDSAGYPGTLLLSTIELRSAGHRTSLRAAAGAAAAGNNKGMVVAAAVVLLVLPQTPDCHGCQPPGSDR